MYINSQVLDLGIESSSDIKLFRAQREVFRGNVISIHLSLSTMTNFPHNVQLCQRALSNQEHEIFSWRYKLALIENKPAYFQFYWRIANRNASLNLNKTTFFVVLCSDRYEYEKFPCLCGYFFKSWAALHVVQGKHKVAQKIMTLSFQFELTPQFFSKFSCFSQWMMTLTGWLHNLPKIKKSFSVFRAKALCEAKALSSKSRQDLLAW